VSRTKDSSPSKKEKKIREPKDPNLRCKAHKFRLYPTRKQVGKLEWMLRRCKELYNAALEERREAYRICGISVSYRMQADQLPAIKRLREEYCDIHSQVLQDVLKRLDKAFAAFFRRAMNGETPGYPRWKNGDRYHSITYPQGGAETGKYLPNGAAAKAGLNSSMLDAGWGGFVQLCVSKAEEAGGTVVKVAPHLTTQMCSGCGCVVPIAKAR
jgi:transposase